MLRSRSDRSIPLEVGSSRRALIRVNSVLARANNRAISLAVLESLWAQPRWNAAVSGS